MKLPSLYVDGFDDCQLNFETLQNLFSNPSSQPLSFLQLLTAKDLQLAFGTGTVTFTASANSAPQVVSHGIGRTPQVVFLQTNNNGTFGGGICFFVVATSSTTFTAEAFTAANGSVTGTASYYWIAIG